jgi:hypothetical protein
MDYFVTFVSIRPLKRFPGRAPRLRIASVDPDDLPYSVEREDHAGEEH